MSDVVEEPKVGGQFLLTSGSRARYGGRVIFLLNERGIPVEARQEAFGGEILILEVYPERIVGRLLVKAAP